MALDERLRRELERAGRPADPSGVYEELIRRRERRRLLRKVEAGALAVVVVLGSIGGFSALTRVFRDGDAESPLVPSATNGVIVFSLPLEGGGVHLFSVASDGSALQQLTPDGDEIYRSPDVSPDGSTIVAVHDVAGDGLGGDVLVTVPIGGGSPTRLIEEPDIVFDPAWSPDGERMAFAGSAGINVLDVATGETRLIPGTDTMLFGGPSWSPDGRTIAFEGAVPDPANPGPSFPWDIYSVQLDGSRLTNLTRTPDEGETFPAWSWTLDRIAFIRGRGPAGQGVYTMASDGSDGVLVFDALPDLEHPAWSPDGAFIAFSADTGQVYTVRADGTDLQPVTGALGEPSWQALPEDATIPPVEPTPSPSPDPTTQDIGLGFPVCNVTSVTGRFADPNTPGIAFVATRMGDTGGCPDATGAFNVVAVDLQSDGLADTSYGPIECENAACVAWAAPDVDGDRTDELLVQNVAFSIAGLKLFEVQMGDGGASLGPVTVPPPGSAAFGYQGFEGGTEPQFWLGGDAGAWDAIRCEPFEGGRALVSTTSSHPIDAPGDVEVTETWFILEGYDLRVVDVREYTAPVNDDTQSYRLTGGCGADLEPYG